MPKSNREWSRRELDKAVKNIDWAGHHIFEIVKRYKPDYPKIYKPLEYILETFNQLQTLINQIHDSY